MERSIEVINRQRVKQIDRESAARLAHETLNRIGRGDAIVSLSFVRDRAIRQLNRDYRGIDKPTDVLSFAYHESEDFQAFGQAFGQALGPALETEREHLGDVVISVETAERSARELGLTFDREIAYLIIHGTLHLAGYDHETDDGEMKRIEKKLRRELL